MDGWMRVRVVISDHGVYMCVLVGGWVGFPWYNSEVYPGYMFKSDASSDEGIPADSVYQ